MMPAKKRNPDFYGELFGENVKPRSAAQSPLESMQSQQAKLEAESAEFGNLATQGQEDLARELSGGGEPEKNIGGESK